MMISEPDSCFQLGPQGMPTTYGVMENVIASSSAGTIGAALDSETHLNALFCNLSVLKDKVQQVQSHIDVVISPAPDQGQENSMVIAGMGTIIQEIIVTASSMMYTCQKMALDSMVHNGGGEFHHPQVKAPNDGSSQPSTEEINHAICIGEGGKEFFSAQTTDEQFHDNHLYNSNNKDADENELQNGVSIEKELCDFSLINCDIIELDAADLLAKFTHYCHVCGKGFKRDANLRMHMRAHGDQYKSNVALSNPMKSNNSRLMGHKDYSSKSPRKYSCPQEGCRWNRRHVKFQPLKSMICVKNHYKRSHCPKIYVCNRCNQKQFSLLSDLRTHEKHCGDLKWQCSCGTTFSRKDKLMGHLALFIGHTPAMNCTVELAKVG